MERRHLVGTYRSGARIVVGQIRVVPREDARDFLVGGIGTQRVRRSEVGAGEAGAVQGQLRGAVEKRPAPPEQEGEERESEPGQPGDKQVAERLVVTHVARVLPFPPVPGRGAWNLEAPHDGVRHGIGEDEQEGDDEQGQRGRRDGQGQAGALPSHAPSEKDGDLPSESGQRGQDREDGARPQRQVRALTGDGREVAGLADGVDEREGKGDRRHQQRDFEPGG